MLFKDTSHSKLEAFTLFFYNMFLLFHGISGGQQLSFVSTLHKMLFIVIGHLFCPEIVHYY